MEGKSNRQRIKKAVPSKEREKSREIPKLLGKKRGIQQKATRKVKGKKMSAEFKFTGN